MISVMKRQIQNELEEHIESWGIMRELEIIESVEAELAHAIDDWHKRGLSYWSILKIFAGFIQRLIMRADAEYYQKQSKEN